MSKVNVELSFTANTSNALSQMKLLSKELQSLSAGNFGTKENPIDKLNPSVQTAIKNVAQLRSILETTVNMDTGKLDLTKFNASLKKNNLTLSDFARNLSALGPQGQQAFSQLAQAIVQSEQPIIRVGKLVKDLGVSLSNTIKWQISSSMIHSFMGGLSGAYHYAQDLNESLNNIRIVTGQSTDQMAKFAVEANKSAKALSATTTDYTNAALIYYQQGLSDAEVKERTDATIKMANVSKQSMQGTSEQMTAIWNNFADGSKALTYYADVITALGAATASSASEISEGLEKFAAISGSIGLSYEYASAALATVTATTRQSADVVGTAFKTLFARIQDLELGKTLEDGVTIGKYAEALHAVGVEVIDSNGQLIDMDNILNNLADRWDDIGQSEKVALAQTVAGTRQYTQLIALMDNWDFMEQNLQTAYNSTGALNEQAEIYAESWEAASDRMAAALERVYTKLIKDDFFIQMLDFGTGLVDTIGTVIDSLGGLQGVLWMLGGVATKVFKEQINNGLTNVRDTVLSLTPSGKKELQELKTKGLDDAFKTMEKSNPEASALVNAQNENLESRKNILSAEIVYQDKLNAQQQAYYNLLKQSYEARMKDREETAKQVDLTKKIAEDSQKEAEKAIRQGKIKRELSDEEKQDIEDKNAEQQKLINKQAMLESGAVLFASEKEKAAIQDEIGSIEERLKSLKEEKEKILKGTELSSDAYNNLLGKAAVDAINKEISSSQSNLNMLAELSKKTSADIAKFTPAQLKEFEQQLKQYKAKAQAFVDQSGDLFKGLPKDIQDNLNQALGDTDFSTILDGLKKAIKEVGPDAAQAGEAINNLQTKLIEALSSSGLSIEDLKIQGIPEEVARIVAQIQANMAGVGAGLAEEDLANTLEKTALSNIQSWENKISATADAITTLGSVISTVQGVIDVFNNPDASGWDKFTAVLTGVVTIVPMIASSVSNLAQVFPGVQSAVVKLIPAFGGAAVAGQTAGTSIAGAWFAALWPIALVIAAIAGVVLALKAIDEASRAEEIAAQKAAEEVGKMSDALTEAKTEADALKSTFEGYDSVVAKLDECTKGTEEWANALTNVNNSVLGIMSDYPELATMVKDGESAIYKDENGALAIRDWAKQEMIDAANQKVLTAQGALFGAQTEKREADIALQEKNLRKDIASRGGRATETIQTSEGTYELDRSATVAQYVVENRDALISAEAEKQGSIAEMLKEQFEGSGINVDYESWSQAIIESGGQFAALNNAIDANITAQQAQADAMAASALATNEKIQKSDYADQVIAASGDVYDTVFNKAMDEYKNTDIADWAGVGTSEGKALWEKFIGIEGDKYTNAKVTNYRKDNTIDFTYEDEEGLTQKANISASQMASIIATSEALEAVGASADALNDKFVSLAGSTDEGDKALMSFLSEKNFNDATKAQMKDLGDAKDELARLGITDYETAKKMGFDSFQSAVDMFTNAVANFDTIRENIATESKTANEVFQNFKASASSENLTNNQLQNVADLYDQAFINSGEAGLSAINEIFSSVGTESADELVDVLSDVDWNNIGLDDLKDMLEEAGISTAGMDTALLDLISTMSDAEKSIESLAEEYANIHKIIDKLKTGDTISEEDYQALGGDYEEFFVQMADGSRMFIGDAEAFYEMVNQNSLQGYMDSIKNLQSQNENIDSLLDRYSNFEDFSGKASAEEKVQYLEIVGGDFTDEQLADWMANPEQWSAEINAALEETSQSWDGLKGKIEENNKALEGTTEKILAASGSFEEMNQRAGELGHEGDVELLNKVSNVVAANVAKKEGFDVKEVYDYAKALEESTEYEVESREEALRMAMAHMKLQRGLDTISKNLKGWTKDLKENEKGTKAYNDTIKEMTEALEDILNLNPSELGSLSDGFFENSKNLTLMEQAARGSKTAIDELHRAASLDIVQNIKVDVDGEALSAEASQALSVVDQMIQDFNYNNPDLTVGTTLDQTGMTEGFQALLDNGAVTVDQMNAILRGIGFEPVIDYTEVPITEFDASQYSSQQTIRVFDPVTGQYTNGTVGSLQTYGGSNQSKVMIPRIRGDNLKTGGSGTSYKGPPSSVSSPPKPTGGGGGGNKEPPKHAEKKSDSDKERYHTVKNQLEDLKANYEEIGEAKDRAFGSEKLSLYDDEIEALDRLIAKQDEYLKEIKQNLPQDKAIMDAYFKDTIGGTIEYDMSGNISNFDEIQDRMFAKYNQMADMYSEEDEEWKVFEKKYEQLEKYIEQYEETYDLLRDEEAERQDLINQMMDAQLEKIQYSIELKVNVAEDALQLLDYQIEKLRDDSYGAAYALKNIINAIGMMGDKAELIYDQIEADREGINKILGQQLSSAEITQVYQGDFSVLNNKGFTDAQIQAIRDYTSDLISQNEALDDIRHTVEEQVMDAFEMWNEEISKGIDLFDHYNSSIEHYKNMVDIVGKSYLNINDELYNSLNTAMVDNSINKLEASKKVYDSMLQARANAEKKYDEAVSSGNEVNIAYWKNTLDQIDESVREAEENMLQSWEDALQSAADQFEATVEQVIANFEKALTPFKTLDDFSTAFDQQKALQDQYLADYEKIYELSKLNRDINNSIDDTKSLAGKQKLKKLLDEINEKQEDGVEMSAYDLEYLQKKYDLRMAEIALEEAQRAKDTVRLTKDNEGNWSYAYTASTDAVDDAQQKYEDALFAMQDLSSNYIDEMSEQLISTSKEMEEALASVRVEDFASQDEYYKKLQEIQDYYQKRLQYEQDEMQKAIDNNKELYDVDWKAYSDATGYKISANEKFKDSYKETMLGALMGAEGDIVDFADKVAAAVGDQDGGLIGGLMDAYVQWALKTEEAMNAAGSSTEDFANDMNEAVNGEGGIIDNSEKATDAVAEMADDMNEHLQVVIDTVANWQETYGAAIDKNIEKNNQMIESINDLVKALAGLNNAGDGGLVGSMETRVRTQSFDTGGYTGEWGATGKLAMLHEKELVLNAQDTSNLLSAVSMTRDLLSTIELNAQAAQSGMGAMVASVLREPNEQVVQQQVDIRAEFPSVTNHFEVEEALSNLVNTASQYANRK